MKTLKICTLVSALALAGVTLLVPQTPDAILKGKSGEIPSIAVTDMRGSGDAQRFMDTFNSTLWDELSGAGVLKMVAKSVYPLDVPQQPSDFRTVAAGASANGRALTDWSRPPVSATYLAFGYTAVQENRLVLFGWLYLLTVNDPAQAQLIGNRYFATVDAEGARKVARDFAADILRQMGVQGLSGSKIYFVSDRSGAKEIWGMDYDGTNQKQLTSYRSTSGMPAISPDGKLVAFTTYAGGNPKIRIQTTDSNRQQTFYNPETSAVGTPEFSPDGKKLLFAATIDGWMQLCIADVNGGNMQRLSRGAPRSIEVSPRLNPKNGTQVLFISGRSGKQQLWLMDLGGGPPERLTTGEGDVANPAWSPDGSKIAFAWTRGYEPGNFNIFVMDAVQRQPVQLTSNSGRNENPWWGPDGIHLVFSSKKGPSTQIYSMLADGKNVKPLTTQGNNIQPVWAKGLN
jgi:TolB protein